jgi:NAD(P)-dependent dehydrogenase (short-subunit alcohol dehydrogenase family)
MTSPTSRVWLITGASSGFGRAIAEAALAAGDSVIGTARRAGALADLVAAHPGRAAALPLDLIDAARIPEAAAEALTAFGRIDVLVNNAGRGHIGAVEETSDAELRELMQLHLFGPAALIRAVLPQMRDRGSGAIVQLSSMGGRFSFPGVGGYSATKFALEGLSEALAKEVAPFGIDVLVVEPGAFRTSFAGGALSQSEPIAAYEDSVGPLRTGLPDSDGQQPGDPAKAAAAILTALAAENTPLRLPLGNDATDMVITQLEDSRAELDTWESVSRSTDY